MLASKCLECCVKNQNMSAANLPGGPQPCNSGLECSTPHWEIWTSSYTHRLKRLHMHFKTCLVLHLCTLQCWPCKMLSTAKLFHTGLVYFCYKPITFIELAVEWLISFSWKSMQNDTNKNSADRAVPKRMLAWRAYATTHWSSSPQKTCHNPLLRMKALALSSIFP